MKQSHGDPQLAAILTCLVFLSALSQAIGGPQEVKGSLLARFKPGAGPGEVNIKVEVREVPVVFGPETFCVDSNGNVFVNDTRNGRVVRLDRDGKWLEPIPTRQECGTLLDMGVNVQGDLVLLAAKGLFWRERGSNKFLRIRDNPLTFFGPGSVVRLSAILGRQALLLSVGGDDPRNFLIGLDFDGRYQRHYDLADAHFDPATGAASFFALDASPERTPQGRYRFTFRRFYTSHSEQQPVTVEPEIVVSEGCELGVGPTDLQGRFFATLFAAKKPDEWPRKRTEFLISREGKVLSAAEVDCLSRHKALEGLHFAEALNGNLYVSVCTEEAYEIWRYPLGEAADKAPQR
ncbi:MAG: hypothetical protein HY318_14300 [Armatimonadetes bacterium]|nr:hypothetical protein [Armatimonadota bacterium]